MDETSDLMEDGIARAARAVGAAEALLIGAGAGLGVDSGLPDFRGDEGFWKAYPPFRARGLSFVDLAQPKWFHVDPAQAWGFYGHRRNAYRATVPHRGFDILKRWADRMPAGHFVFTSNVDGHFQKAGFSADRIVECHGSLEHLQCLAGCRDDIWLAGEEPINVDATNFQAGEPLPRCPHCGALARPNVLMFGDGEWLADRTQRQRHRYQRWQRETAGKRLVVVELGAGMAVPTVRSECEWQRGTLIRINVREPQVPRGAIGIARGALAALVGMDKLLK